ncbi:multicopper oxidase family protein [Acidicapsa dinghuensis]|uniref:Multicopper oxidase family protein n=1 Tax=Acidicapsa dinghuensis TaxID=2218256 RepID=A0ABW1EGR7_9BACT|nr:multicopper oxidase [Acidicapsa dinghuensis]
MTHHLVSEQAKQQSTVRPWLHPERLARYVDPLPKPEPLVAKETRPHPHKPGGQVAYHRIAMRRVDVKVHRDLPPTSIWSYGSTAPGPTIEARKGEPMMIEWVNELPEKHFLPVDHTLCGAGKDLPEVRTAVHVHGARVEADSDGYPEDWSVSGQSKTAFYPMEQDAATLWYHDHAMGIERLNQYAGLFGFFLVRDTEEDALNLPRGKYEIPLAISDRLFYADGGLHYPDSGDPEAPWVSEVYGDVILANGVIWPYLDVEPRLYRIRLLNASNSRTYFFSLSNGHAFHQIGTDQGLLAAPVEMKQLMLAPAERADLLIDFSSLAGTKFVLQDGKLEILQFRVAETANTAKTQASGMPTLLRHIEPIAESSAVRTRSFTLNEYMDPKTRLMLMLLNGQYWHDPVTEKPLLDSVEIWSLINTTQDVHPIHLHLVRFQILDRLPFDVDTFLNNKQLNYLGSAAPPEPNERGWKDTVKAHPETVTRIIVPFQGYAGRYVWHCHLLEHAAREMMRPFEVVSATHKA